MKLEGHPCVRLDIEVKPVFLRIGVQASEVVKLALRKVEVRIGEGC